MGQMLRTRDLHVPLPQTHSAPLPPGKGMSCWVGKHRGWESIVGGNAPGVPGSLLLQGGRTCSHQVGAEPCAMEGESRPGTEGLQGLLP